MPAHRLVLVEGWPREAVLIEIVFGFHDGLEGIRQDGRSEGCDGSRMNRRKNDESASTHSKRNVRMGGGEV